MVVNECGCCGSVATLTVNEQWLECACCNVFINLAYHDTPIAWADGIRQVPREIVADITKFVSVLDTIEAKGPLYDVCAGYGTLPYLCMLRSIKAAGNEISPGAIALAKDLFGVDLEYGQFEDLPYEHGSYGEVVFHHGIEHVISPRRSILKAINMLRPGGRIYMAHPVMRDGIWLRERGSGAHRHEWTYASFQVFISQFEWLSILSSSCGEFNNGDAGQTWIVEKRSSVNL